MIESSDEGGQNDGGKTIEKKESLLQLDFCPHNSCQILGALSGLFAV